MIEKLVISQEQLTYMLAIVSNNLRELLSSEVCRRYLALDRWKKHSALAILDDEMSNVMPGTIDHNRAEIDRELFASTRRTQRLISPLSSIEQIYKNPSSLKVLSIGPRTEMEIFNLMSAGFSYKNIEAIDLISNSPFIKVGDMHNLPYGNKEFDIVMAGWVLSYSANPGLALSEMVRVCKDGGILAVGVTYEPSLPEGFIGKSEGNVVAGNNYKRADDIACIINRNIDKVYFQQDAEENEEPSAVMLIAKIKHNLEDNDVTN